jgi:hypothetical protein
VRAVRGSWAAKHVTLAFPERTVSSEWPPGAPMPDGLVDALRARLRDMTNEAPHAKRGGRVEQFKALSSLQRQLTASSTASDTTSTTSTAAAARHIQSKFRARSSRRWFQNIKRAALSIQSVVRGRSTRRSLGFAAHAAAFDGVSDVFISHRVSDAHHAAVELQRELEASGLTVFVPNALAHSAAAITACAIAAASGRRMKLR